MGVRMRYKLFTIAILLCPVLLFSNILVAGVLQSYSVWVCMAEDGQIRIINSSTYQVVSVVNVTVGTFPWGIDFSPDGRYAYVTCRDTNNVVVIDTTVLEETTSIDVGDKPFGISVAPDGEHAYVSNMDDDTVSVISLETNSVVATINVGDEPMTVDIAPDGVHAYVCLWRDDRIAVLRLSDNVVLGTIEVGEGPWGVDVAPDGRHAYVSCEGANKVAVIRLSDSKVVKRVEVNDNPRGLAILPNGEGVYIPAKEAVAIIDTASNIKIDASGIHGMGWEAAITPDGLYAYVSTGEHTGAEGVEVIEISRMEKIETIYLGEGTFGPRGIAIHPVTSSGKILTTISCLAESVVGEGETITVSGAIIPTLGGKTVTLAFTRPDGSTLNRTALTGSEGSYSDSFAPDMEGEWRVQALWCGDETHLAASSVSLSFTVGRSDEDGGPLVLIFIVIVVIILVLVFSRRRGRNSGQEKRKETKTMRASRILQIIRDVMLLILSSLLMATSYGKWVGEPVHYVLFGSAAVLLILTIINLVLLAAKVKKRRTSTSMLFYSSS